MFIGTQSLYPITISILLTLLNEVEGILNAKPFSYVLSDIVDPNSVTPNMLMAQQDT